VIFVTVGTQLPFGRLIRAIDEWAMKNPSVEIFGQIGPGSYKPANFSAREFISPVEFNDLISRAELIVAHAGMGSILTALQLCKPIIIFPRRASLGEHRNEHQLATAKKFLGRPGISVAFDIPELYQLLGDCSSIKGGACIDEYACPELISRIRHWIKGHP
jgi:UDP-N-acetylglucosamine transferase subunit ALG13